MRPRFNRVNTKYDVGPDHVMIYAHLIIPKDREGELRTKFNNLLGWYLARNNILGINNKTEKYKEQPYEPKYTSGERGRPRKTIHLPEQESD